MDVDWDVGFWSRRYPAHYLAVYNRALGKPPADKLTALWRWKTLNRAPYAPRDLIPYLADAQELINGVSGSVAEQPLSAVTDAFVELRRRLKTTEGPLSPDSRVAVTPQFLLHLVDSDGSYSGRFPILDVMVARAWRTHTAEDESTTLQGSLTCSRGSYRRLMQYFYERCETASQIAKLERALFMQGRAIGYYRENEGVYDEIRNVPVEASKQYLEDIVQHSAPEG
jgi:hypothetical protein